MSDKEFMKIMLQGILGGLVFWGWIYLMLIMLPAIAMAI